MKQILTVLKFEFLNYAKQKSMIIMTLILVLAVGVAFSWGRIEELFDEKQPGSEIVDNEGEDTTGNTDETPSGSESEPPSKTKVAVIDKTGGTAFDLETYKMAFEQTDFDLIQIESDEESLKSAIIEKTYEFGIIIEGPLEYTRLIRNVSMNDRFPSILNSVMKNFYQYSKLYEYNIPDGEIGNILNMSVEYEDNLLNNGKDQEQSFFYTYVLVFFLYFAILVYGQFVSTSVATEKSTRAMELLITSAKTVNLMFGKVLGAGAAGITQLLIVLGFGAVFYNMNSAYNADNFIMESIFSMPVSIVGYTVLFFLLGFFIYAFLYASLASLVSRMEELASAVMPVTFIFIGAFMITMIGMGSGEVDSLLMKVCSFIPLTSPMAMFARISMGDVNSIEIIISIVLLVLSNIGAGIMAAKIYRLGVLLYGNPPKIKNIFKMLKNS